MAHQLGDNNILIRTGVLEPLPKLEGRCFIIHADKEKLHRLT
jgi:hypothetical protein